MKRERGVILILSFIILVAMTSVVGTYLFATSVVTRSAGFGEVDDRVLWLAEAGLRKAIWSLMTPIPVGRGENWTTAGTTESLGGGTYTMVVARWDFALAANGSTASDAPTQPNPALGPARAIDGNNATYWQSRDRPANNNPQNLTIAFPYPLTINKVRFISPDAASRPREYTWQVSTDGVTYLVVFTGNINSNSITDVTDVFTARTNVNFLRLSITRPQAGGGGTRARVATLEAIGSKITSTGTFSSLSRTLIQTVVADDGAPQNQVAFYEPDWVEQ